MMRKYFAQIVEIIKNLDRKPIGDLLEKLIEMKKHGGRIFILGVGGSAANASHCVNDFRKLMGMECYTPTDNVAELTARTNDEGWENCFVDWLKVSKLKSEDLVLIFSVGGGNREKNVSVNLIKALDYTQEVGATTAGIVGRDGGYTKQVADICILIPTVNEYLITPFVESFQAIIWHLLAFHPYLNEKQGKWEELTK